MSQCKVQHNTEVIGIYRYFRYDVVITKIDDDVKTCEDVSDTLGGLTAKIETTTNNEPELFVTLKKAKKSVQEGLSNSFLL
jgi:hypothetical protein